eukprot:CAMPEP_0201475944 /NCGR_PEP_ID=MMETSP0151_2-20130828/1241_1 /ASSEMBLY_ACC=CAM_ASM_000257 /TAXON_ID=200890 /ORGANISM="Paramoeba atlantica, Strain 621/1 / CCAP 1560/9" /LENGTH=812 /DNA_ID=CAMNT_0047856159 /DNA_START=57 /DNA_END=2495 /DNA_ORIENTATION=-
MGSTNREICEGFVEKLLTATDQDLFSSVVPAWSPRVEKGRLSFEDVLQTLYQLILQIRRATAEDPDKRIPSSQMSDAKQLGVLSAGLSRSIVAIEFPTHVKELDGKLRGEVVEMMKQILGLQSNALGQVYSSLVLSQQAVFEAAVGFDLTELGFTGFKGQPMIYGADSNARELTYSLKIPLSSYRSVPLVPSPGSQKGCTMCVETLKEMISEDVRANRVPVLVIASLGGGRRDQLDVIGSICLKNEIWLHAQGEDIPLVLSSSGPLAKALDSADSFCVDAADLFDIADTHACTFFREPIPRTLPPSSDSLFSLPLWIHLQCLGKSEFSECMERAVELSNDFTKQLSVCDSIRIENPPADSISSLSVYFRYVPPQEAGDLSAEGVDDLAKYLFQSLTETAKNAQTELACLHDRLCFRFRPLLFGEKDCEEPLKAFYSDLMNQIRKINETIQGQPLFSAAVEKEKEMELVNVPRSVGLGAVRFYPSFLPRDSLSPEMKYEVDTLNSRLTTKLKEESGIFTEGLSDKGDVCVKVGVHDLEISHSRISELMDLIRETAMNLNLYLKLMADMADMIQKSIKEAEEQLLEEKTMKESNKGFLGNIPYVNTVWSWWGAPAPDTVTGRSFDIARNSAPMASTAAIKRPPPSQEKKKKEEEGEKKEGEVVEILMNGVEEEKKEEGGEKEKEKEEEKEEEEKEEEKEEGEKGEEEGEKEEEKEEEKEKEEEGEEEVGIVEIKEEEKEEGKEEEEEEEEEEQQQPEVEPFEDKITDEERISDEKEKEQPLPTPDNEQAGATAPSEKLQEKEEEEKEEEKPSTD